MGILKLDSLEKVGLNLEFAEVETLKMVSNGLNDALTEVQNQWRTELTTLLSLAQRSRTISSTSRRSLRCAPTSTTRLRVTSRSRSSLPPRTTATRTTVPPRMALSIFLRLAVHRKVGLARGFAHAGVSSGTTLPP